MGILIQIIEEPIDRSRYDQTLPEKNIGAVVEFLGIVRDDEDGKTIQGIEYEVFREMAEHQLRLISERVVMKYDISDFLCAHRIGFIEAGQPSLFIRASAHHREEAFEGVKEFITELKKSVPIWKHPVF